MGTKMFNGVAHGNSSYLEEYQNQIALSSKVLGVLREVEILLNRLRSVENKDSSLHRESMLLLEKVKDLINDFN